MRNPKTLKTPAIAGSVFRQRELYSKPKDILDANKGATSGVYSFVDSSGSTFDYYVLMEYGFAWTRAQTTVGTYSSAFSTSGRRNGLSGNSTGAIGYNSNSCSGQSQDQGAVYGCPGATYQSKVNVSSSFQSAWGLTKTRYNVTVSSNNGYCGYLGSGLSNINVITGNTTQIVVCTGAYTYGAATGNFTHEAYADITSSVCFTTWTACAGSFTLAINNLWVA